MITNFAETFFIGKMYIMQNILRMIPTKVLICLLIIILIVILAITLTSLSRLHFSKSSSVSGGAYGGCDHVDCNHITGACDECMRGGCDTCGGGGDAPSSTLSPLGREVIGASVRVEAQNKAKGMYYGGSEDAKKPTKTNGGKLTKAVRDGDQDKVAQYLAKSARSDEDKDALELRTLKPDIINVIGAYPGLVEYTRSIETTSTNKNIVDAVEDIKTAIRSKSGGSDVSRKSGGNDSITEDVYTLMKPYIREVGNSRSIEMYLKRKGKVSVSAKDVPEEVKKDRGIKHKILYEIIRKIIDKNWNIQSKEDFIEHMGLRYEHFIPAARRQWLSMADDLDIDVVPDLRNELRVYLRENRNSGARTFTRAELDKVLDKIEGSLSIFKFAPGYAKKTKAAIKKAKGKAFEVDTLAILPLLKSTAVSLYDASRWTDTVNLIRNIGAYRLRSPEEEAVRTILLALSDDRESDIIKQTRKVINEELERERRLRNLEQREREQRERMEREREQERRRAISELPDPSLLAPPPPPMMDEHDNLPPPPPPDDDDDDDGIPPPPPNGAGGERESSDNMNMHIDDI